MLPRRNRASALVEIPMADGILLHPARKWAAVLLVAVILAWTTHAR